MVTYRVEGARQLRRALKQAGDDLQDLKATHAAVAGIVIRRAETLVPRRDDVLAGTIRPGATKTAAIGRAGYKRVPYANPIHWGWPKRHIAPNPFMSNAAQQTEPSWTEVYMQRLEQILTDIQRSTP